MEKTEYYSRIFIGSGGGIISDSQLTKAADNSVHIYVGLGTDGVDCLRVIKGHLYARIRPDVSRNKKGIPVREYTHIRFLGVQNDLKKALEHHHVYTHVRMRRTLTQQEMFDIDKGLSEAKEIAITRRIEKLLMEATKGLTEPSVYVHVITSLSDGMGSKIFPKICYRIRFALRDLPDARILGYFFLPSVDMSKLPFVMDKMKVRIMAEGYAGIRRLDTFMSIELNGGSYEQKVPVIPKPKKKDGDGEEEEDGQEEPDAKYVELEPGRIAWKCMPLDWCYLASSEDDKGMLIHRGYEYALNSVAEHVMDYMVNDVNDIRLKNVLDDHIRFAQKATVLDQEVHRYSSLGNSALIVPFREINTALATELWSLFASREEREPTERDVFHFIGEILNDPNIETLLDEAEAKERRNAERDARILQEAGFSMDSDAALPELFRDLEQKNSAKPEIDDDADDELIWDREQSTMSEDSEIEREDDDVELKESAEDGRPAEEGSWKAAKGLLEEQELIQDELSHLEYEKVEFLQELESIHKEMKNHEIYERLYLDLFGELTNSVGIPGKYPYDLKYAMDHPESVTEFFDQQSYKLISNLDDGEARIFSYNSESPLVRKIRLSMQELVCDFEHGLKFVSAMLDPSFEYSIEKALDGILEINEEHIFEYHYGEKIQQEFDEARKNFENGTRRGFGDTNKKRLRDYLEAGERLLVLTIYGEELASITKAIERMREELRELEAFFRNLGEITGTIDRTFAMNKELFDKTDVIADGHPCAVSMVRKEDIESLKEKIFRNINHRSLYADYMKELLEHPEEWQDNDQDKISWQINSFVCDVFKEYANIHMEDCYRKLFHKTDVKMIESAVSIDYLPEMLKKAHLQMIFDFRTDSKKAPTKFRYKEQRLSLPVSMRDVSDVFRETCDKREKNKFKSRKEKWMFREKNMTDLVYLQDADVAIPLSSLCHMGAYEAAYRFVTQTR
uniref:tubulin-like doman-containing protein n=1 Tax=Eubacterium cellulosolvens TaxID=29322 RepID=UPI0004865E3F|nr:tubulin-like doman-containing protein [[Eubacterium] cellulosolvens]